MSNLTPYQSLRRIREQIYESIQESLLSSSDSAAFVGDMQMTLFFNIEERDFRMLSSMKEGYQILSLSVWEGKDYQDRPNEFYLEEVPELQIISKYTQMQYSRRMRMNFIGPSLHPIPLESIGNEFKMCLLNFLRK